MKTELLSEGVINALREHYEEGERECDLDGGTWTTLAELVAHEMVCTG